MDPECGVHVRAVHRHASCGTFPLREPLSAQRVLLQQRHPGPDDVNLGRDTETLLESLDSPVVVFLDHQRLAHICKYISQYTQRFIVSAGRVRQVSSRFFVSGIQIHMIAARKKATPATANAAKKPRDAASEPTTNGAAALAMRPVL